ncbi:MAG: GNAT family N-acetyltransferase [Pseudomonadota bacterium]
MKNVPTIEPYQDADRAEALGLFDANAPAFFHPGERGVFERFLTERASIYRLVHRGSVIAGAFGLGDEGLGRGRIVWFMADPSHHGQGLGRLMIEAIRREAEERGVSTIDISASHISEDFYAYFGAKTLSRTDHGWGEGMHRVDMIWEI